MLDKAYSTLDIKSIDEDQRIIEGIASTPSPDRQGDVMEPKGARFSLPMPLLWHHNTKEPIGEVFDAVVRDDGIHVKARIANVTTPGRLQDRVSEAWDSLKFKLVRGLSIGWSPIEFEPIKGTRYTKYTQWFWGELSAVTIPANMQATILSVKSIDQAASGPDSPGVSGSAPVLRLQKAAPIMTIPEQIAALQARRATNLAKLNQIQAKNSADGTTKDQAEREEFTTLKLEIKTIDDELVDLHDMEKLNIASATPVTPTVNPVVASDLRGGQPVMPVITVKSMQPKGTAFTRMCMSLAAGKGDSYQAMSRAETYRDMPEVALMTKAAVAAGTTTDATWAGPLAVAQPLVDEFLELLRPRTLLGRIPGLRQVPFNVSVPAQTTGGTYAWVGQNKPKPVTKADYTTISVPFAKAAGIIVLTEELVKLSSPSAEALVREEMIAGMSQFLDTQFTDPAVTAVANVNPAAITVGASTAAASGTTAAAAKLDLSASVAVFTAAGVPLDGSVWLMNDSNAWGISISLNALGQPLFPGMSAQGGTIFGMPVVVSNNVSNRVVLMHAPSILYADEGGVRIDTSREASIQMDSAPTDTVDATTVYVSLWQRNLVGLRAERMITWIRARTAAVRYITAAAYAGT